MPSPCLQTIDSTVLFRFIDAGLLPADTIYLVGGQHPDAQTVHAFLMFSKPDSSFRNTDPDSVIIFFPHSSAPERVPSVLNLVLALPI